MTIIEKGKYSAEDKMIIRFRQESDFHSTSTLLLEYTVVPRRGDSSARRKIDGIIIKNRPNGILKNDQEHQGISLAGADVVVIQAKTGALGMDLLGQTLFSRQLVQERKHPAIATSIAICGRGAALLHELADDLLTDTIGIKVVAYEDMYKKHTPTRPRDLDADLIEDYEHRMKGKSRRGFNIAPGHNLGEWGVVEAIMVLDEPNNEGLRLAAPQQEVPLEDRWVQLICTSNRRVGMYALGHVLFASLVMRRNYPATTVEPVLLVRDDDEILHPIAQKYGVRIVVSKVA